MESKQRLAALLGLFARFRLGSLMWLSLVVAVLLMWYRDRSRLELQIASLSGRNRVAWSIDQLLGPPNTNAAGDIPTAWASQMPDAGMEWVVVEFPYTAKAIGVDVYETYCPGAIVRVSSVSMNGTEQVIWEGKDPVVATLSPPTRVVVTEAGDYHPLLRTRPLYSSGGGVSKIRFTDPVSTRRLKIYLDSSAVPGWNEIDAVALVDKNGKQQWASNAWASSAFGSNRKLPTWFYP